jgi:8-oxo-dGTP pyrophosphatase MutT (NUDIX family)
MELNTRPVTTALRHAATVVMLRDASAGLEVFLIKRHGLSDVLGGAYVFPGGKLDESDAALDIEAHLDQTAEALHTALAESETSPLTAAALYVAALRETFEEAGVLFSNTQTVTLQQHTALPHITFNQMLAERTLRLNTRAVQPWSRWITPTNPSVSSKRFDTRFFVSAIPHGQVALHDNHEATESVWLAPRAALAQYWNGEIQLAPPQIMSLAHLARHPHVESVLSQARRTPPPVIQPEATDHQGERLICYPGDPLHPVRQRAMPGPTRLLYRNKRFEPPEGFEALFG